MKKLLILMLLFVFVFTFIGCDDDFNDSSQNSKTNSGNHLQTNDNEILRTDAYRRGKRQLAIADSNNDIYLISHTSLNKLSSKDGNLYTLLDNFEFGHDIDLHNEYIYYQIGSTLYRMDKNENNIETCQLNLEPYLIFDSFNIINDTLCIAVYNDRNDMKVEYLYADILDDPISLSFSSNKKFNFEKYEIEINDYRLMIKSKSDFNVDLQIVDTTANYIYFAASSSTEGGPHKLGRVSVETQKIEMIDIFPYRPEKVTIVNGWIYYEPREAGKTKEIWRMSEDLTQKESLK